MSPESAEEYDKRMIEELKGKNLAFYSVMLGAFIQTKMERDKTLVTVSLGGLGYLITTVTYVGLSSLWDLALFIGGFAGFMLTVVAALVIYNRNAELIEYELRGGASIQSKPRPDLKQLDRFIVTFFSVALLCAIFVGSKIGWSKYMASTDKSIKSTQTQVQESLEGVGRLHPANNEYQRSVHGLENLAPSAISPTPGTQSPTAGAATPTQAPVTQSPAQNKPKE